MDKQQLKLTKVNTKSRQTDSKKSVIAGSIIATLIAITPYLFYLYESVPDTQVWDTFLFTFDAKSWESSNYLAWVLTSKIIPLFLLLIWFFTNRHWWYHVLMVPIAMYVYQIFGLFNENITYWDEFQLMYLVPVMAIVIPSVYLIRARIFNKMNDANKTLEELEEEFKIKPRSFRDYF